MIMRMKQSLLGLLAVVFSLFVVNTAHADPTDLVKKNEIPRLSSSSTIPTKVYPPSGDSGNEFAFGVEYLDYDGEQCNPCLVWIDINQDGDYGANEKFDMVLVDSSSNAEIPKSEWGNQIWTQWRRFQFKTTIENTRLDTQFTYRFVFSDGIDEPVEMRDYLEPQSVSVRPLIVVDVDPLRYQVVPGGTLRVVVRAYLNQKIVQNLALKWDAIDKMVLPSGIALRNRKSSIHRATSDFDVAELTLDFDIDRSLPVGTYQIQFPSMTFERTIAGPDPKKPATKIRGSFMIPTVSIQVVPIFLSTPVITAKALTLGTAFDYFFTVSLSADFKDADALVATLRAQTFLPLRRISHEVIKTGLSGHASVISVHYVLAMEDDVPKQYQIPGFSVGSLSVSPQPLIMFPIEPPGKIPTDKAEMSELTARLLVLSAPILPSGNMQSRTFLFYVMGGSSAILVCMVFVLGRMRMKSHLANKLAQQESFRLKSLYETYCCAQFSYDRDSSISNLGNAYHALRNWLAAKGKRSDIADGVLADELAEILQMPSDDPLILRLREFEDRYFMTM